MRAEQAETIALQALGWLAAQEELFFTFLAATGADGADIAKAATNPEFLGSVIDFLMNEDQWIIAFCDQAELPYDSPMQARAALPGGQQIHWT